MGWLADTKGKLRRFLLYISNKASSRVSCSLIFSWHHLPKFSNWIFTPFYPFSPAWPQFISVAQRSCVISASLSHPQRNSRMLWIKKTKESCSDPFKWLYEWERMENAALTPPPHPFSTDKHHTGDISAHSKHCCEGLCSDKEHTFIFKPGTTREDCSTQWTKTVHDP